MQPWKSILTILDKPKHPQTALQRSVELQEKTSAHLHLVSFCWSSLRDEQLVLDPGQCLALENSLVEKRRAWMRKEVHELTKDTDTSMEAVFTDDIAGWAADTAATQSRDLIVKSVNHSETLVHTPLDWHLLRSSPVPVMLCADRKRKPSGNVLAAVDLRHGDEAHTRLNEKVLEAAQYAAEASGATLHCVYAVEYSEVLSDLDIIDKHQIEKRATEKLGPVFEEMVAPYGIAPENVHMKTGKVGKVVSGTCYGVNADLLVLGTVARGGMRGRLLGNSAERVLTKAPCDVLCVVPDQES